MAQRAGRMRHVVEWQEPTTVRDGASATITWATTASKRAEINPNTGREYVNGERVIGETTHLITMRGIPALEPEDRFLQTSTGRIFNIVAIAEKRLIRATMIVQCREKLD